MKFVVKGRITNEQAKTFAFAAQKTMYGGKQIAKGDTIFIFASEHEGGSGLIACGIVTSAKSVPRKPGIARQTPRVSISVTRTALARRGWEEVSSRVFPTGKTVGLRPSSTSNFIGRQQTRSRAFQIRQQRSFADSFNPVLGPGLLISSIAERVACDVRISWSRYYETHRQSRPGWRRIYRRVRDRPGGGWHPYGRNRWFEYAEFRRHVRVWRLPPLRRGVWSGCGPCHLPFSLFPQTMFAILACPLVYRSGYSSHWPRSVDRLCGCPNS
jgi:hypothetical protein